MIERGFIPDFSKEVEEEVVELARAPMEVEDSTPDLRSHLWCSIDNDDSRDLDQLTVAERLTDGRVKVLVAVADVDALVKKDTAIDRRAATNTTSVYTGAVIFPMLPLELSTALTSLNQDEDRLAMIVELTVGADGCVEKGDVYRALVRNRAKLAYNSVAAWIDGEGPMPEPMAAVPGMEAQIRMQDEVAQKLKERRHENGALDLESLEARPVFDGDAIQDMRLDRKNRARELIEDFMIAANGVTARFLHSKGYTSLRRVVRSPERWTRIVEVAAEHGETLPPEPDARALEAFLVKRRKIDPIRFPDLSLVIVKLMGKGEYVVERPGQKATGHFGLAVRDYAHSTAPNRRYPDLVTHRLLKTALAKSRAAYSVEELELIAARSTEQEDDANKIERQVRKSAAALLLESRLGERFEGIVTGASAKGTWVRIFHPPVEGKIVDGAEGLDVGKKVMVKLVDTDVERGFIDFVRVH
jgi:VacB/RNase II family 3'-5' exoribonuclease